MNALTQPDLTRADLIDAAMCDSLPEGRPWAAILEYHLAKRGLVIVETARLERIQPFDATLAHPDAKTLIARAARIAREGCLVPPDGGSPTEEERQMCAQIAEAIEDLL
jgi:hypothetical protein